MVVHLLHLAAQKDTVVPQQMSLAVSCVNAVAILSCAALAEPEQELVADEDTDDPLPSKF